MCTCHVRTCSPRVGPSNIIQPVEPSFLSCPQLNSEEYFCSVCYIIKDYLGFLVLLTAGCWGGPCYSLKTFALPLSYISNVKILITMDLGRGKPRHAKEGGLGRELFSHKNFWAGVIVQRLESMSCTKLTGI